MGFFVKCKPHETAVVVLDLGPCGEVEGDPQRESKMLVEILSRQKQQLALQVLFVQGSSRRWQDKEPGRNPIAVSGLSDLLQAFPQRGENQVSSHRQAQI